MVAEKSSSLSAKDQAARIAWINRNISTSHVGIGEVRYKPGGIWRPYTQRFYELAILHTGSCAVTVDDETLDMEVGMVYLFRPGHTQHSHFSTEVETHHAWCKIKAAHMPREIRAALEIAPQFIRPSEIWTRTLKSAMEVGPPQNDADLWEIDFLSLTLFAEFLRCTENLTRKKEIDEPVRKAVACMHEHLGKADCLARSQKASGLSSNGLIARFHAALQTTPGRYLWRLRTERGISMLKEGGLRVSDVAYHCGFTDPFHFSRMVKKHQGLSPRQIRVQNLEGKIES